MNQDQILNLIQTLFKVGGGALAAKGIGDSSVWEAIGGAVVAAVTWYLSHKWHATPSAAPSVGVSSMLKLLIVCVLLSALATACTTNQQTLAANTLSTLEQSATAAVDGYDTLVIQGNLPTNGVPTVTKAYNDFQAALMLALDGVQYNTNAVAPPALTVEAQDLVNLINTIETNR